jgi:hypothetical protein
MRPYGKGTGLGDALVSLHVGRDQVQRETAKAYAIIRHDGMTGLHDALVWIPKSQVTWVPMPSYGDTMHVPCWLASKLFGRG